MTALEALLGDHGVLVRALGGHARPAQLSMAEATLAALEEERALLVEAGTGTGKTFAYLVPAILSEQRVVISTATRALQDQLVEKDLPFLREVLQEIGIEFEFAAMKGLGNYLCLRRLERALVNHAGRPASRERLVQIKKRAIVLENEEHEPGASTAPGDAATFGLSDDDSLWSEIQSSSDTRVGAGCRYYERCFVTKMKQRAQAARLVVVNHHLFFADLVLKSGDRQRWAAAIPDYDAVVFDEAHQIEQVASEFFGETRTQLRWRHLVAELTRFCAGQARASERCKRLVEAACNAGDAMFDLLATLQHGQGRTPLEPKHAPPELISLLDQCISALTLAAEELDEQDSLDFESTLLSRRALDYGGGLERIRAAIAGDALGSAKLEQETGMLAFLGRDGDNLSLAALPVDVAPSLRLKLFSRPGAIVLTSATLQTGSTSRPTFFYTRRRLGVPSAARELSLPTPFDVRSQVLLYTATDLPEPAEPEFEERAFDRVIKLIQLSRGGAFVLTTSRRMLLSLAARLEEHMPVLVQGRRPKTQMLEEFRRSGNGVLLGTKSFWEGVDVPGLALRLVILDRLPFPVPTDPLWLARRSRLEAEGGNAFAELSLPHAMLTLKQGFGRLLRHESDVGVVCVLDRRLYTKSYGKRLIAGLPPASRTTDLHEVEAFTRARIWPRLKGAQATTGALNE